MSSANLHIRAHERLWNGPKLAGAELTLPTQGLVKQMLVKQRLLDRLGMV